MSQEEYVAELRFCQAPDCSGVWCPCREKIEEQIRSARAQARDEALEEAASRITVGTSWVLSESLDIAERCAGRIRSLKSQA